MKLRLLGLVVAVAGTRALLAQGSALLQFSLDRPGPPALQYTITLDDSGKGSYTPRLLPTIVAAGSGAQLDADSKAIQVSPAIAKKLFAAVPVVEGGQCETHNKGIAKTGVKVLRYTGAGHEGQCTYNYSNEDRLNDATSAFEALAETLQFGDRLRAKLRFDRLGLDEELSGLQAAVAEQRALEVGNIAPLLKTIAGDERVMDRVRRKAELLLQSATTPAATDGAGSSAQ